MAKYYRSSRERPHKIFSILGDVDKCLLAEKLKRGWVHRTYHSNSSMAFSSKTSGILAGQNVACAYSSRETSLEDESVPTFRMKRPCFG